MQVDNVPPRLREPVERWSAGALRLSAVNRLVLIAGGLLLLSTFVVASRLQPDPRGFGTHQQLSWLAPCGFRDWSGLPCPSCGMTTAWAHLVRGEWRLAWQANAFGCGVAMVSAVVGTWGLISGICGRWLLATPRTSVVLTGLVGLGLFGLGQWLAQLLRFF